ncbi:PilW family protein [Glaciecola sp. 1036]|uniref:PilW family protein n=1 Tax=Alteromonadaceae TaxID=72275 RepID=UPI003D07CD45
MRMYSSISKQRGVTLVELMIALALGLMIASAIVKILVSNSVTDKLNKAVASAQENGRFIISRIRQDVLMTGFYDPLDPNLSRLVDIAEEGVFIRNHAVAIPNDFANRPALGSIQGADGANDTLVIAKQGLRDCRGYKLGYLAEQEFFVVNEYFVDDGKLKCRGFDGRVLRGQKVAVGNNGDAAFTLVDDVLSFQVMYGITIPNNTDGVTRPVQYIDASDLEDALDNNAFVVAIRIAIVVKGEGDGFVDQPAKFTLLNEDTITAPDKGLYKAFETTITLRNAKNFAKGSA